MQHTTSPKDVFLQLFATAMLYLSIIGTFIASFTLTNWYISSEVQGYPTNVEDLGNILSFPLAMLTVTFPLFIWSSSMLYTRMKKNTDLQHSRARAWLTNLTLFLAAIIIAITAIAVVYTFFDGDLTVRTVIKSAVVLLVSVLSILWYRGGEEKGHVDVKQRIVAVVAVVLFVAVLVTGVVAMGSPKERRMLKADRELRYSLQDTYYNLESSLMTQNTIAFPEEFKTQHDAVTYNKTSDTSAELCATFQTRFDASDDRYYAKPSPTLLGREQEAMIVMPDWSHEPGENCFTLEIL